jgi:hypothetical protein
MPMPETLGSSSQLVLISPPEFAWFLRTMLPGRPRSNWRSEPQSTLTGRESPRSSSNSMMTFTGVTVCQDSPGNCHARGCIHQVCGKTQQLLLGRAQRRRLMRKIVNLRNTTVSKRNNFRAIQAKVAAEKLTTSHSEGLNSPEESAFSWIWRRNADLSLRSDDKKALFPQPAKPTIFFVPESYCIYCTCNLSVVNFPPPLFTNI